MQCCHNATVSYVLHGPLCLFDKRSSNVHVFGLTTSFHSSNRVGTSTWLISGISWLERVCNSQNLSSWAQEVWKTCQIFLVSPSVAVPDSDKLKISVKRIVHLIASGIQCLVRESVTGHLKSEQWRERILERSCACETICKHIKSDATSMVPNPRGPSLPRLLPSPTDLRALEIQRMLPRWLEEQEDAKELLRTAQAIVNKVVPTTVPVWFLCSIPTLCFYCGFHRCISVEVSFRNWS